MDCVVVAELAAVLLEDAAVELELSSVVVLLLVVELLFSAALELVVLDEFSVAVLLLSAALLLELALCSSLEASELDLSLADESSLAECFFALLELALDDLTTRLVLLLDLAPLTVLVVLLTTTLVAPSAKTIETIANGEINGGVR